MEKILKEILSTVKSLDSKVDSLDSKVNSLDSKVDSLDSKVNSLDSKVESLDSRLTSLESKVDNIEEQQKENTQILRALEHKTDIHHSLLDNITNNVAELKGNQKTMQEDIDDIKHDVNVMAINTAKNSLDIAKIRGIR